MMSNIQRNLLRCLSLVVMLVSFIPINQPAQAQTTLPPVDMFQLPWDEGIAWVAIDGFDDGSDRPLGSSHNYRNGGAVDFAPRPTMFTGEDTSKFWVAAAAAGTVTEISKCHLKITHSGGWITEYQFLGNIQVKLGDTVARNQRLGIIADGIRYKYCPGYVEPNVPHVHFTLRPTMVGATFAGWQFKYNAFWNTTTFAKDGKIVSLYKPLLNVMSQPIPTATPTGQASATPTATTGTPGTPQVTNTPDGSVTATATGQATNTPDPNATATPTLQVTNTPDPNATATPTPTGQSTFTPTPTPAGQSTFTPTPTPASPYVSTTVDPATLAIGGTALTTVSLNNVPAEGYTSTEFTCTFDPALVQTSNITVTNLFGADAVAAFNVPQSGKFIVAIAGSQGNKATASGAAFTFDVTALQAGQTTIDCQARVSIGDNTLTSLPSFVAALTILEFTPTPTFTPTPAFTPTLPPPTATSGGPTFTPAPTNTAIPTVPADWLTFTNLTYGFQFKYPPQSVIASGGTDNFTRIDLPFVPGTNLSEKYLEVAVVENANPCRSPVAASSMVDSSETVTINGISFLKEIGGDAGAGNFYQFVAYSTLRDNVCVSLSFVLHSLNPGNFATPPVVFDYAAESAVFGQIVATYSWLSQLPTATPTFASTPVESPTPELTSTPVASPTPLFTPTTVASPTPTPLPVGMLTGQVHASKAVTINLYNADDTLAASVPANVDGTFAFTVPPGTYKAVATASGFLSAQGSVTITAGNTATLPTISLQAGDIDNNNVIDQLDALTIGMNYNSATPTAADLNNDGIINILDLELLARNYRNTGPIVWQ
ncbi:MAG TPA: peptidoglycan DD-metalloendopeptidase family protein [Anaerolineales bacterium]|nr:peptidoglycan DD-metalloendopeptidase family protein [Anaerolineales bacterium]